LMEDAATAEISRTQLWSWIRHGARLDDGRVVTPALVDQMLAEEMERVRAEVGEERFRSGRFEPAIELFRRISLAPELEEFLTLPAYVVLNRIHPA